ncbi:MAG: NADPH:quinone reductase [Devosia sp.]|nr:NADPH:quinone reductase [Devosia sp.]
MRSIIYHRYGEPADVLQVTEAPALPAPGNGEILIRATSRPIHPGGLTRSVDCQERLVALCLELSGNAL